MYSKYTQKIFNNTNNNASLSKLLNPVKTTKTVNLFGVDIKVTNGDSKTQLLEQLYQQLGFFFNILQAGEKNYRSNTSRNKPPKNDKNLLLNPNWLASVLGFLENELQLNGIAITSSNRSTFMSDPFQKTLETSQIDPTHIMLDSDSEEFFSATSISSDESSFDDSDIAERRSLSSPSLGEPGKRKRGRPRKYVDPTQSPWKKDPNAPKRKRGRPRKYPAPQNTAVTPRTVSDNNNSVGSDSSPNDDSTSVFIIEPRKTPGKRGRPRKHPLPTPSLASPSM